MTESNSNQAPQQPPKPDPALKHLDAFVGKWEYLGEDANWHHWMDVKLTKAE